MPPPPKHRTGETSGGMAPPEHRLKGKLESAGSSGGAVMPQPQLREKGTGSREKAAGAGATGPAGEIPLANLSNLIGSAGFRHKEPRSPITATQALRNARERKYTRPSSSSFPRDPSPRTGQQLRSTKSNRGRFSLLTIADSFNSRSLDDHLSNTGARGLRESATRLGPMEKPGTGLSGGLKPLNPRLTVKAGRALSLDTPPNHWGVTDLNVETQQECQSVTGSNVETPWKHQAVTGSSGVPPRKHQVVLGSSGVPPRKHQAVTGSIGRTPPKHQAATGSNGGMPRKHQAATGSSVGMPRKHQAAMGSGGGMPWKHQAVVGSSVGTLRKHQAVTGLTVGTPRKQHQVVAGSSGEMPRKNQMKEKAGLALSGEMSQRSYKKETTKPSPQLRHPSGIQRARPITDLPAIREKKHSERNASVPRKSLLTGQKPRRTSSKPGNTTAKDRKESTASKNEQRTEEMIMNIHEVEYAIQELNELGLGEDISYEEFEGYLQLLPCEPPEVDTSLQPDYEQLDELQFRKILYRIKYCKFARQCRKNNEMYNAELEDDHPLYLLAEKLECLEEDVTKLELDQLLEYLEKEGLLRQIENNMIFDWSFLYHPVVGLDDYQRLVPQNYGGCGYEDWDIYQEYFHSYEIELEYLWYWKELLKELKWMEDYVLIKRPSLEWGKICTRGCYQAIKIASHFFMITETLARRAYYDCLDAICLDIYWYNELDGVFFEIWQRITKLKESFKEALNEVFKSEKFPLRHHKMKDALDNDRNCSQMEKEFRTCTAGITLEMTEDKGRELIAYAIRHQREGPKFYAQYIEKKIEVAEAIGVIPTIDWASR